MADNKINRKSEIWFGTDRKHCGKRRKCWYQHFLLFPQCFQKSYFLGHLKSGLCGKELTKLKLSNVNSFIFAQVYIFVVKYSIEDTSSHISAEMNFLLQSGTSISSQNSQQEMEGEEGD